MQFLTIASQALTFCAEQEERRVVETHVIHNYQ